MQNDNIDPVIDKYRKELLEFSRRNPKFSSSVPTAGTIKAEKENITEKDEFESIPVQNVKGAENKDEYESFRENVARKESESVMTMATDDDNGIRDELEFSENAQMYPPYNNGDQKSYRNIEEFLVDNPKSGFLRVQVFAGEQTFPVSNANIVVTKNFGSRENVFYEENTDISGVMSRVSLPAPDKSLSVYPTSLQPYSTYDISVTHPGYNKVVIHNCVVFDGIETAQMVELIPGLSVDGDPTTVTETFDTLNGGD